MGAGGERAQHRHPAAWSHGTILELCHQYGDGVARRLYAASVEAVNAVVDLIRHERLDCGGGL